MWIEDKHGSIQCSLSNQITVHKPKNQICFIVMNWLKFFSITKTFHFRKKKTNLITLMLRIQSKKICSSWIDAIFVKDNHLVYYLRKLCLFISCQILKKLFLLNMLNCSDRLLDFHSLRLTINFMKMSAYILGNILAFKVWYWSYW